MKFAQFKTFRDSKNKLIVSYWTMNKGEMFITCDLSKTGIKVDNDDNLYNDMIAQPKLKHNIAPSCLVYDNFLNWFDAIVYNKIYRRS